MTVAALSSGPQPALPLLTQEVPFGTIPRTTWDTLLAATACATPFSRWTFHRAWWDAYGETSEARYLVSCRPDTDDIDGIVPLMTRSGDGDGDTASAPPTLFLGATYHADYATILCHPDDIPAVTEAMARTVTRPLDRPWDTIDLRRLRADDPVLSGLTDAFRTVAPDWGARIVQEDVCPVVTLPADGDWEAYLATLDKKARHEIRRKLRRAEAVGPVRFRELPLEPASVESFIALHQARWGAQGLFAATLDGDRSRRFLHRLTELEAAEGVSAQLVLGEVSVGDRVVVSTAAFDDGTTCFFYNAGMDPAARDLSPGVTGTAAYIRDRMESGRTRFDFLRGDESYKYEWGAVDEPVARIVVTPP
jgi:CelD/BcsL family acetyltransferase involved in cellulose biosynthesis